MALLNHTAGFQQIPPGALIEWIQGAQREIRWQHDELFLPRFLWNIPDDQLDLNDVQATVDADFYTATVTTAGVGSHVSAGEPLRRLQGTKTVQDFQDGAQELTLGVWVPTDIWPAVIPPNITTDVPVVVLWLTMRYEDTVSNPPVEYVSILRDQLAIRRGPSSGA